MNLMLTAIVLAKNEAENIKDCLATLAFCDQTLVIDDQSTDDTVTLAQEAGATVIKHPLNHDYAAQRNYALTQAKNGWVLFVDADERVSPELASEIQTAIQNSNYQGYFLKREDILFGKKLTHGETVNVRLLRLAQKSAGQWSRQVHETWQIKGPVGELQNPLKHYSHQDLTGFLTKMNEYSTLHAQVLYKQGIKASLFQIIFYPLGKFLQNWLLRGGFLDGMPGFIMAWMMSFHSFLSRAKLYLLWKE